MNKNTEKFRLWESAALLALCAALCAGVWAQGRQSAVSAGLVRLHVVAASDSRREQALKLRVRDAVLTVLTPLLDEAEDVKQARALIGENLERVEAAARAASGGEPVRVSLSRENYPTRRYAGFTLPAGEYESLQVVLGEGRGRNWWCIVFPPLCVSAAQGERLREVMDPEDVKLLCEEEGYELRFKLVELWGELKNRLAEGG